MLFSFGRSKRDDGDKAGAFWRWFAENEQRFRDVTSLRAGELNEISTAIHRVNPDLSFEIGGNPQSGPLDIVVSANGIKSVFPAVIDLVNSAPEIPGWRVVAFRQPRGSTGVRFEGQMLTLDQVYFTAAPADGRLDVVLHCSGLTPANEKWMKGATFLLLDGLLGEFDVSTRVGAIDWVPLEPGGGVPGLHPLAELPKALPDVLAN